MAIVPTKRIRDQKRYVRPQQTFSFSEWEDVSTKAAFAEAFLKEDNPLYLALRGKLVEAENTILDGVREVREEYTVTDIFKKIFIKSKKARMDELVGQVQVLSTFLLEVQGWVAHKKELETKEANGEISIQRDKENEK